MGHVQNGTGRAGGPHAPSSLRLGQIARPVSQSFVVAPLAVIVISLAGTGEAWTESTSS
jgi:hypothetical protein